MEVIEDREQKAERLIRESGKRTHSSDCATSIAPAEEPGHCDCGAVDLSIQGQAGRPIWVMCDGTEPWIIGVRLDNGDAGAFYLTREQATDLSKQLTDCVIELTKQV